MTTCIAPTVLPQQDLVHRPVVVCLLGSCGIQKLAHDPVSVAAVSDGKTSFPGGI